MEEESIYRELEDIRDEMNLLKAREQELLRQIVDGHRKTKIREIREVGNG